MDASKKRVTAVIEQLALLTPAELATVEKHFKMLTATATRAVVEQDWLMSGIVLALRRRGVLGPSARPRLQDIRASAPDYDDQAASIRAALLLGLRYKPRPNDLVVLGELAADALIDDLDGGPAPICLQTVLRGLPRMLGALDKSYPGYLSCGLLGYIIQAGKGASGAR